MRDRSIDKDLTLWQRMQLETLWGFCRIFAWTPYWFRYYAVQPVLVFLLMVIRYRRKVVLANLKNSFPEKSRIELLPIMHLFYRTLSEVAVDTMSMAGITPAKGSDLVRWRNGEEHKLRVAGRDWIAMASHYGCWEYFPLWCWVDPDPDRTFMGVYHPLHSPVFERFYHRLRDVAPSMKPIPMRECVRYYMRHCNEEHANITIGLIADQNPPLRPDSHWFRFLNQDTVFFDGAEKLALRFRLPVYFVHVDRLKRGRYEIWFEELYDGVSPVAPNEITERYVRRLEEMIRTRPELWMWSHRRWKHRRPE